MTQKEPPALSVKGQGGRLCEEARGRSRRSAAERRTAGATPRPPARSRSTALDSGTTDWTETYQLSMPASEV